MRKTKSELELELELREQELAEIKKELEIIKRHNKYKEAANELRVIVDSLVEAGFTEDMATTLILTLAGAAK